MSQPESRRLALYNQLQDLLGTEPATTLMSYLPTSAPADLATVGDIERVESRIIRVEERMGWIEDDIHHISRRLDRLYQTMLGGFIALVAAMIAAGFVG